MSRKLRGIAPMLSVPLTLMDLVVIAILLISGALAFFRGFVHEVLSIGGWVGSGFAAWYGYDTSPSVCYTGCHSGEVGRLCCGCCRYLSNHACAAINCDRCRNAACPRSLFKLFGSCSWFSFWVGSCGLSSSRSFGSHLRYTHSQKVGLTGLRRRARCPSSKPALKLLKPLFPKILKLRAIGRARSLRPAKIKPEALALKKLHDKLLRPEPAAMGSPLGSAPVPSSQSRDMIRCQATVLTSSFKSNNLLPHQAKVRNLGFSSPLTPLRGCT